MVASPLLSFLSLIAWISVTRNKIFEISKQLGKEPVIVNDYPGFVSNRVLMPMLREAIVCLEEGIGSAEDIDKTIKLGLNHPMGPLMFYYR